MADLLEQLKTGLADRYAIVREIGSGGMATVYLAEDLKHHRQVAVKVLRPELAAVVGCERFLQEVQIAANLNHPHILTLIDSGEAEGLLYYVMPYVKGESLRAKLSREKKLPISEAVRIAEEVASALGYAHEQGVVHRDIKPGNILMHEGKAIVADFGIAIALHMAGGSRLTESGLSLGTPEYMSPEQATGDSQLDARSDIYSLAAVLYEMLVGEPPHTGRDTRVVIAKLLTEKPTPPRILRDTVPRSLDEAVMKALAKVPADRFSTTVAFAEAITRPHALSESLSHLTTHRRPLMLTLASLLGLGILTAALFTWLRTPGPVGPGGTETMLRLVASGTSIRYVTLSPDGRFVAYVGEQRGQRDLFVRPVSEGQAIQLTDDAALEGDPAFSPDGERIAFHRQDSLYAPYAIWTVGTFGGQAIKVINGGRYPTWSPDGTRLGFVREAPNEHDVLMTAAANGSDERELFRNEDPYFTMGNPSWSPDDSHLAVLRTLGGMSAEIWLISLEGEATQLTGHAADIYTWDPVYTPDGSGVLHTSNRGGVPDLWVIPVDGGEPERLTSSPATESSPSIAGDGAIAYVNVGYGTELLVYDLEDHTRRVLTANTNPLWAPVFSPDGSTVAVSRAEADGAWHIWLFDIVAGSGNQLTFGSPPQIYPQFMPSGDQILYSSLTFQSSAPQSDAQVFRVPAGGGPPVALTLPIDSATYADVSPDGTQLVYTRGARLYIAPITGGEARLLPPSYGTVARWSPDGQWIAFSRDQTFVSGVFVIRPDGTDERRIAETGGWPMWLPDSKRVGYVVIGSDGSQALVVPLEGGAPRPLADITFTGYNHLFDITSDGRLLTTTNQVQLPDEIWLMEPKR